MDYAFNSDNQVLGAALAMSNAVASLAIERTDEAAKAGGGDVSLTGPYTGAADVTIDVRIVDEDIDGTPSASAPVFAGVGNATITTPTGAAGMLGETFTLTVENLGTETRFAQAQFQGATLRATTPGPRAIRIEIEPELTLTDTDVALRETIPKDADVLDGLHWNFGAVALTADGDIPATAQRRQIGIEPTIFRQYMRWDNERRRYVYALSPRPPRAIPAGALVRSVSGTYTMTVTENETVEVFAGLVTLYDALDALRSRSQLIRPTTAVVADRRPGGMAAVDLSVITSSYCASIEPDGGDGVQRADILLVVGPGAPMENLSIEFVDSTTAEVRGEISGWIGRASVGEEFTSEHYAFRIPRPPTDPETTGAQTVLILRLTARDGGSTPSLCTYLTRDGINLRNGTTKWVYGPMPPAPCPCGDIEVDNAPPSDDCLGIEQEDNTVSEASRVLRMQRVATWLREFAMQNTYQYDGFANDLLIARRGADIHLKCLDAISGGTLDNPKWAAAKVYKVDQVVEPTTENGFRYCIKVGGTSVTEPSWNTAIGSEVTQDGIVYENIGRKPLFMWDDGFEQLKRDTAGLFPAHGTIGAGAQVWRPDWTGTGEVVLLPTVDNGHYYAWVSGTWPGSFGSTEPTWPTDGSDITVGDSTYRDAGVYGGLARETEYDVDDVVFSVYHGALLCIDDGETAATMPGYLGLYVNDTFVDGTVTWKITAKGTASDGNASLPASETFWARHEAICNDTRAAAGIKGNFTQSSNTEVCWTPVVGATGAFWYDGSDEPGYMHVFPNHWNVMAKEGPDGIYSTREGAFLPIISCADALVVGDSLTRVVSGVTGTGSGWYQQGDRWLCRITAAGPVELGGGQAGDDTTTISVLGTASGRLRDYLVYRPAPAAYEGGADAWDTDAEYVDGDHVRPSVANGLRYRAEGSGDPGAIEPAWPTDVDDTVVDGDITWRCVGPDTQVGFAVAEGGIRLALGDSWIFAFEGGHFEWRTNGGSWSSPIAIAPIVSLTTGLSAVFAGGSTPSWQTDDTWSFRATAVAGVDNLRRPTGRAARWLGSTVIDIAPAGSTANRLIIAQHEIPQGATITFQGSDDNWSTTAFSVTVPWRKGDIHVPVVLPRLRYRILVNTSGGIFWLFLGALFRPTIRTGSTERGVWEPVVRMPTPVRRGGVGGRVSHVRLPQVVWDSFEQRLAAACFDDQRRFAIVPNTGESPVHLVSLSGEPEPRDNYGFASLDLAKRFIAVDLQLEAA